MNIQLRKYDILESTNLTAVQEAVQGAAEGTVIIAARQTDGHGRMQRVWTSPEGGLWFSIILRPQILPQFAAQLTLLAGVAVTRAIHSLYEDARAAIKWPNDILFDGKKICGILAELKLTEQGDVDYAVIGIGVNVNLQNDDFTDALKNTAVSLAAATGKSFSCERVLHEILKHFLKLYDNWLQNGAWEILSEWKSLNCTLGNRVIVKDNDKEIFRGVAASIDEYGALIVRNEQMQERSFDFGEISIR